MNARTALTLSLCLTLCGAYLHGQLGTEPSELDIVTVRDDVFVLQNEFVPGNATALVTDEGVILVDNKFAVDYQNIVELLRTVTDQPVRYVINTHHHGDHSGSNASFQEANAQIIASEPARRNMVYLDQPGQPALTFTNQARLALGGKSVELYHFGRAHTNGDVFVYFPEHRILATGDTFTYGAATPQLVDYQGGGSAKEWTATLDRALRLNFDTVIPGHGDVTTREELAAFRDSTLAMQNRVREMLLQERTPDEIAEALRSDFQGAQLVFPGALDGLLLELR
jgi:cyclase